MWCSHCNRDLTRCICDDFDERIAHLRKSPFLDSGMFDRIEAFRATIMPEIEADREAAKKKEAEE